MMKIQDRLIIFIEKCYKTRKAFAEKIGEQANSVYRYGNTTTAPGYEKLAKFQEAGLSIDWLVTGLGSMYAFNEIGLELRDKFEFLEDPAGNKPVVKLTHWIIRNYSSLRDFSIIMNVDYKEVYDILINDYAMAPDFLRTLDQAGCNLDWVIKNEGDEYSNTPAGHILKYKKEQMNSDFGDSPPEQIPAVYNYPEKQKPNTDKMTFYSTIEKQN